MQIVVDHVDGATLTAVAQLGLGESVYPGMELEALETMPMPDYDDPAIWFGEIRANSKLQRGTPAAFVR